MTNLIEDKKKVIYVDWLLFVHRAIFAWVHRKNVPAPYTCMTMILSCLKKVGVAPDDIVIVAIDSPKGSWRREIDPAYKANRKAKRDSRTDIPWKQMWSDFRELLENLKTSTPFHFIEIEKFEADDLISYGVRCDKFKDYTHVIISSDSDFDQLTRFPSTYIFSPITKKYKIIQNPYDSLAKKMDKEVSDNLLTPILSQKDYERRNKIVNLTILPPEIEAKIEIELQKINEHKEFNTNLMKFRSIRERFMSIYNSSEVVSISKSFKKKQKKLEQKILI